MKKTQTTKPSRTPATPSDTPPKLAPTTHRAPRVIQPIALATPPGPAATPMSSAPTVITAEVDVGFGNTLYIRGEGPGLTWDAGIPLECIAVSKWRISIPAVQRAIVFKFLINDCRWSAGDNLTAPAGSSLNFVATFD